MSEQNVFGEDLVSCSCRPMTGFYRDGYCNVGEEDLGLHSVCIQATEEFLEFSKQAGNDLSTPMPDFGFAGIKAGDKWCLCAARYLEAYQAGKAPYVFLTSTNAKTLEIVPLEFLKERALDLS